MSTDRLSTDLPATAPRLTTWIAGVTFAGMVVLVALGQVVSVRLGSGVDLFVVAMLSFPFVGVVVLSRRPRNAVGWILLAIGGFWALGVALGLYGQLGLTAEPALPAAGAALALTEGLWVPSIGLIGTFLLLLFPDGRLPSPRWRPVAWCSALTLAGCYSAITLSPGSLAASGFPGVSNPLGVDAVGSAPAVLVSLVALVPLCIVACAAG